MINFYFDEVGPNYICFGYIFQIMDEKSLIKKYQKEISSLKQELQQLKRGMMENKIMMAPNQEDLVNLKLQVCSSRK